MSETGNQLIDGEQLKGLLEKAIENSDSKLVIISAYITQVAVDWLAKHVPQGIEVHMVCRLQPFDVINGSTHIPALIKAIDKGWSVSCLHSLHAKIYAIDDELIYAGSANLTSNGLKIYGMGNLEASVRISPSEQNLSFIESVRSSSTVMSKNILKKMQFYVEGKKAEIHTFKWPVDILDEREGVWAQDFFWTQSCTSDDKDGSSHDLEMLGIKNFDCGDALLTEKVWDSRCIQWLVSTLKNENDQELFFGSLTKALHDDLKDDPAPYRKDVKALIQNMLSYCESYLSDYIEVSRPNYSQRIKLLKA